MEKVAPAWFERVRSFGPQQNLVGITTHPVTARPEMPAVIFVNAGIIHRVGPNRLHVRLARTLAAHGIPSLRFDLAGLGDSTVAETANGSGLLERSLDEVDVAIQRACEWFAVERIVMMGLCSGADHALRALGRRNRVVGAVLLDLNAHPTPGFHLRKNLRAIASADTWSLAVTGRHPAIRRITSRFGRNGSVVDGDARGPAAMLPDAVLPLDLMRDHFRRAVRRRARILAVFTAGLEFQYNYRGQFLDMMKGVDFGSSLQLEYYADSDHTFSREQLRERLERTILDWLLTNDFTATALDGFEAAVPGVPS